MRPIQATFILMTLIPSQAYAASLSDFVGEWRGKGTFMRQTTTERVGKLTCRINVVDSEKNSIVVYGRCAAPEGSRGFKTRITAGNNSAIWGVDLTGAGTRKSRPSEGVLNNTGLSLIGSDDAGSFEFRLSTPQAGQMEMQSAASKNGKSESARILLRKVD